MIGKRVYRTSDDGLPKPGEFYRHHAEGTWYAMTPNGHLANLAAHKVEEHEDGTITVSPSILVSGRGQELWHGDLERGVWRSV